MTWHWPCNDLDLAGNMIDDTLEESLFTGTKGKVTMSYYLKLDLSNHPSLCMTLTLIWPWQWSWRGTRSMSGLGCVSPWPWRSGLSCSCLGLWPWVSPSPLHDLGRCTSCWPSLFKTLEFAVFAAYKWHKWHLNRYFFLLKTKCVNVLFSVEVDICEMQKKS